MTEIPKALVLDFGGVITKTVFETHRDNEKALGLPVGALTWRGPFDPDGDDLWRAMQRDEISERDYWLTRARETGELVGQEFDTMAKLIGAIRGEHPVTAIRPQAVATIKTAKQAGFKLAILSNELDLFYGTDLRTKLPFLDDFDVIVDATYTKILKPDIGAYEIVCEELVLAPDECLFVDDQARNIAGAELAGLKCIQFDVTDPDLSYQKVAQTLGLETMETHNA